MSQAHASRRAYAFNRGLLELSPYLREDRPIAHLRSLSTVVWRREARLKHAAPKIVAGAGWDLGPKWGLTSYSQKGLIVLTRDQRNIGVLLHELAHALGPHDKLTHGPAFIERLVRLLHLYGAVHPAKLMAAVLKSGVDRT